MLAGAETDKVGQGTGRSPGIRAFAGITPESRHPLPKNQNTYQFADSGSYRWTFAVGSFICFLKDSEGLMPIY
jgi:hypothetical protein